MTPFSREDWEDLLVLSQTETAAKPLIARLLAHWCQAHQAEAAALYLDRGNLLERECTHGAREFPDIYDLAAPNPEFARGLALVRLPAGALLYAPGDVPLADASTLLISEAAKALRLQRQLKEQRFQANYRGVELEALYDVGLKVAGTLDLEQLSEEILLHAVMLLDARRGALYLLGPEGYRLQRTFGGEAEAAFEAHDVGLARFVAGGEAPETLLPGARHLLGVGIEIEGSPRGLIAVGDKESRRGVGPFRAADRRSLGLFANQAAIALENARLHLQALEKERLEREMSLAAEIQRQILPKGSPDVPGYEVAGWNRPAAQVGGDYYGFLDAGAGRFGVALGDVSGKGMPAALLVSTLHSALRLLAERDGGVGTGFLERLNTHLADSSTANKFVTLFFAQLHPETGELDYLNAGHNPALLLRRDGHLDELGSGGVPLGLIRAARFESQRTELSPGDLLCLYSDGITEATAPDDEEFGMDRLGTILSSYRDMPLAELIEAIDGAVTAFAQGHPQADDQTVVLVRRVG